MAVSCPEMVYITCLLLALTSALLGYLSPLWQVAHISKGKYEQTSMHVGLFYACVIRDYFNRESNVCKTLALSGKLPLGVATPRVAQVRWLLSTHLVFMFVSAGLNLVSPACTPHRQWARRLATVFAAFSSATGVCGLAIYCTSKTGFQRLFEAAFPSVEDYTVQKFGFAFYLSCFGCALFSFVSGVEVALRLRDVCRTRLEKRERSKLLSDEIKQVYGSSRFLLDSSSGVGSDVTSNKPAFWTRIETCSVEIFRSMEKRKADRPQEHFQIEKYGALAHYKNFP